MYEALVRIPLGTVLLKEVAFRGALPAVLTGRFGLARAAVVSSLLFGLWHIQSAWELADVNPVVDDALGNGWVGQTAGIALAVAATFVAGLWLCLLRYRAGSLLAPVIAHVATNSLGFTIAS